MPHSPDQNNRLPRRSIFQSPRHPTVQYLARTDIPTTSTLTPQHFSDGSHSLRRSLNVAQNLSRLAEAQPPTIPQMMSLGNTNGNSHSGTRVSTWSQQPRIRHSQAIVGLTTSLAGSTSHGSGGFSSSSSMPSSGMQTFQQQHPQAIHPNIVVRTATPAYTNSNSDRMASMRDSVMEQMRSHVQSQQQPRSQQWLWGDNNITYTMPRDDSESRDPDTESEEEEEEQGEEDEDMELDEHEHEDDRRYFGQTQALDDYNQRQYNSQASSSRFSLLDGTPLVTRGQNYVSSQGSSPPSLQQQQQQQPSHRHPQQFPSSRRIILPPHEMPPLSWSRQSSVSSGYSSQPSHSPNQQQPQYSQRHPQEIDRRRDSSYRQQQPVTPEYQPFNSSRQQQGPRQSMLESTMTLETPRQQQQRPAFLSQPVYQLACAACIRPLCLRAMKAVMLSDHSKELYSTDMPPAGLQLVNDDRQVRHCTCRIRDSACLGCGQVAGYHVTQPCSDCLKDQNNGHFWMFYSSAVVHYKRLRVDGHVGDVMLWANVPSINYDQALAQQLRREVPILSVRTTTSSSQSSSSFSSRDQYSSLNHSSSNDERPLTACVEMEEWLNSPMAEVVCR
ncbi:Protein fam72a [Linnemannia elongata]|nr:Protein fam72a [Linnemannia elongata]